MSTDGLSHQASRYHHAQPAPHRANHIWSRVWGTRCVGCVAGCCGLLRAAADADDDETDEADETVRAAADATDDETDEADETVRAAADATDEPSEE